MNENTDVNENNSTNINDNDATNQDNISFIPSSYNKFESSEEISNNPSSSKITNQNQIISSKENDENNYNFKSPKKIAFPSDIFSLITFK